MVDSHEVSRMNALRGILNLGHLRRALPVALSALSLVIALPVASSVAGEDTQPVADADLAFSELPVRDDTLAQIRGTGDGDGPALPWDEDDSSGGGSNQDINIGNFNTGNGFNDSNAVAVAVVHQHAVQIVGSGGIDDVVGN